MSMTKKDYELIAKVLGNAKRKIISERMTSNQVYHYMIGAFSACLTLDNPRFDKDKFFEACDKYILE